jgi:hypothetical protein
VEPKPKKKVKVVEEPEELVKITSENNELLGLGAEDAEGVPESTTHTVLLSDRTFEEMPICEPTKMAIR